MIKKLAFYTIALFGAIVLLNSCKKDYEDVKTIDDRRIQEYLSKNNIAGLAADDKSGYFYVLNNPSAGTIYTNMDSIRYRVVAKSMETGTVYTSSPTASNLGTLVGYTGSLQGLGIPAMNQVILKLKPGGTARIFVPSYLAFGKNGNTTLNIPSNEIIEIDITTFAETQSQLDQQQITAFLTKNALTATLAPSGVHYIITQAGTGTDQINLNSDISVIYTGRLLDGTVFDSSTEAVVFNLRTVVQGWEVLQGMTKGTKIRLFIPSALAYGIAGNTGIPGNSVLDFDLEITEVAN